MLTCLADLEVNHFILSYLCSDKFNPLSTDNVEMVWYHLALFHCVQMHMFFWGNVHSGYRNVQDGYIHSWEGHFNRKMPSFDFVNLLYDDNTVWPLFLSLLSESFYLKRMFLLWIDLFMLWINTLWSHYCLVFTLQKTSKRLLLGDGIVQSDHRFASNFGIPVTGWHVVTNNLSLQIIYPFFN